MKLAVELSGPLFDPGASHKIRAAAQAAVQRLMELGEQRLDETLRPRPAGVYLSVEQAGRGKASTGHYRRSIHATVGSLHARIDDGRVVYGPWLEGIGSRNARSRFKGYHSFRRVRDWLEKQKDRVARATFLRRVLRDLN